MKNIVSFETAKRLRSAGFPQPKPEAGQFWFDPYGDLYIALFTQDSFVHMREVGKNSHGWTTALNGWTFAPSTPELASIQPEAAAAAWLSQHEK